MEIEGVELTFSQSMTVRVALETFAMSLRSEGLGDDRTGRSIAKNYLARIDEIRRLIARGAK
jgi:hypothetical protein